MNTRRTTQGFSFGKKEEADVWVRVFVAALPDCMNVKRKWSAIYCAHIAAEAADAAVIEYRRRAK
jgi:hypothetical protein